MYKAIHVETGEEIIILHPAWRGRIEQLRELDHADRLVCQNCRQPLRVKAGEVKRPHFAHKHLKACSLGSETPEILLARGVLYEFLLAYFGDGVTLEHQLAGAALPRPVDCWVETATGSLAYWLIEGGIKLEPREAIKQALSQPGIHPTYLMLHDMLVEEKKLFDSLLLSTTERAFAQVTPFDQLLAGKGPSGSSLHFLDAERGLLTSYRNLTVVHRPNWYKGLKKTTALEQVLVDRRAGHLIHPGEEQRLHAFLKQQQRLAEKRQQFNQRLSRWADRPEASEAAPPDADLTSTGADHNLPEDAAAEPDHLGESPASAPSDRPVKGGWGISRQRPPIEPGQPEALECAQCGQLTSDYWMVFYQGERKMCRCRTCLESMA